MLELKKDVLYRDGNPIDVKLAYKYMQEQIQINEDCKIADIINLLEANEAELNDILGFYLNNGKTIRDIINAFNYIGTPEESSDGDFGTMAVWSASLHDHSNSFIHDVSELPGITTDKNGAVKFVFDLPLFLVSREVKEDEKIYTYNYMLIDIPLHWIKDAYFTSFPSYVVRDGNHHIAEYNRLMSLYDILRGFLMASTNDQSLEDKLIYTKNYDYLQDLDLHEVLDVEDLELEPYKSLLDKLDLAIEKNDLDEEAKIYKNIKKIANEIKQLRKLQIKK